MRNHSIDTLKAICAIFIIYIHTPQPALWDSAITPLIRCAVPIFFIISGYLTYGKKQIDKLIIRRITTISKMLCWGFIIYFLGFVVINGKDSLEHLQIFLSSGFLLFNIIPYGMHLWYLLAYIYVLIIIYFVEKYNLYKFLFYTVPILLFTALIFGKYSEVAQLPPLHTRNFLFTGIPFFTLGMIIKHINKLPTIGWAITGCILFYIIGVIEVIYINGLGELYFSSIFLSVSIFILFLNIKQRSDNPISKIGREDSLYIYVFHFLFSIAFSQISNHIPYFPYFSAPIVLCLTLILIKILRRLKIIGNII